LEGNTNVSETALGSRLGIGMDLLFGRLFTLGIGAGYQLVANFENRIGSGKTTPVPTSPCPLGSLSAVSPSWEVFL
jgi:hypothetical protein